MAGVLLHWAMGAEEKTDPENGEYSPSFQRAYLIGLLLPDLAKQGLIDSRETLARFFGGCRPEHVPTYEDYLSFCSTHHFNPDPRDPSQQDTRNPKLEAFLAAGYTDLRHPAWQGAFCHLMGDKAFYYGSFCVEDARAMADYRREVGELPGWDGQRWRASKTGRTYYQDYDVLNRRVEEEYGVLDRASRLLDPALLEELLTAFGVRFSDARPEPLYMNLENLKRYIACSRRLNRNLETRGPAEALALFRGNALERVFRPIDSEE